MPQSSLPDLNTLWLKWIDVSNNCLKQNDFNGSIASVFHLNAVLSTENRVEINTEKYNQLTLEHLNVKCNSCKEEIPHDEIKYYDSFLSSFHQVLLQKKTLRVWNCPNCNKPNSLKDTEFIQERFSSPRYLRVVPEPPKEKRGIQGRRDFKIETQNWVRHAQDEISYSLGIERREYVSKNDRDIMEDNDDND